MKYLFTIISFVLCLNVFSQNKDEIKKVENKVQSIVNTFIYPSGKIYINDGNQTLYMSSLYGDNNIDTVEVSIKDIVFIEYAKKTTIGNSLNPSVTYHSLYFLTTQNAVATSYGKNNRFVINFNDDINEDIIEELMDSYKKLIEWNDGYYNKKITPSILNKFNLKHYN